ncbi:hypothetical protein FH972_019530 [Carpinus fangiana]|uniref:Tyrosine-protein kinase catalytic domain-containing protein n=1 Tax=Carpinus fangiana TaxID=176857 RepID=A0A5N6RQQ2_9ROSI|nr:hypothetical protein FH972_019530 [Carpinus fangiana]
MINAITLIFFLQTDFMSPSENGTGISLGAKIGIVAAGAFVIFLGILIDGTIIAVKQLSSKSKQGNREFVNEIGMISALQHPHFVKLYGCCIEGNQLLLALVLKEKGSLLELVDPRLGPNYKTEEVMVMINVALLCTNVSPTIRPTMSAVVSMLEGRALVPELVPDPIISNDEMKVNALVLKEKGSLLELVDPRLGSNYKTEEVMVTINVALLCTNVSPTVRPTMSAVVSMLEGRALVPGLVPGPTLVKQFIFISLPIFPLLLPLSLQSPLNLSPSPITTTFGTERHHRRRHPPNSTSGPPPTTPTIQEPAGRTPPTAPDHCRHHQALMPTTIQCLRSPPTVPAPTISPPPIFPKIFPRSFL